jgi:hypothetical protein
MNDRKDSNRTHENTEPLNSTLDSQVHTQLESQLDARLDAFRTQLNRAAPNLAMPPTLSTARSFSFRGPLYVLLAALTAIAGIAGGRQFVSASKPQRIEQTSRTTALASQPKPATVQTKQIHLHAAFGVYVCGKYLPNRDGSAEPDPEGVHLHDDGLIHIHPFAKTAKPTVDTFLRWARIRLVDAQTLSMPAYKTYVGANQPAQTYRVADNCKGSTDPARKGRAALYQFDKDGKATLLEASALLRDDMVIAVAVHGGNEPLPPPPPSIANLSAPSDMPSQNAGIVLAVSGSEVRLNPPVKANDEWPVAFTLTSPKDASPLSVRVNCPQSFTSIAVMPQTTMGATITTWATPDSSFKPNHTLTIGSESMNTLVFPVLESRPGWLLVRLPVRPNGTNGWIRSSDVKLFTNPFMLVFYQAKKKLVTCENGKEVRNDAVTSSAQLPTEPMYLLDLTKPGNKLADGPFAFGLSGFSKEGSLRLGITAGPKNRPMNKSHPGIQVSDEVMTVLASKLFLGTPFIVAP